MNEGVNDSEDSIELNVSIHSKINQDANNDIKELEDY